MWWRLSRVPGPGSGSPSNPGCVYFSEECAAFTVSKVTGSSLLCRERVPHPVQERLLPLGSCGVHRYVVYYFTCLMTL